MFTEAEAATKWCPFNIARADSARCIGSECMVWQWGPLAATRTSNQLITDHPVDGVRKGCCGLANAQWTP